jgi:ABC-type nitrate/sulfonate/bicarbonate transport system substrate-binding protein
MASAGAIRPFSPNPVRATASGRTRKRLRLARLMSLADSPTHRPYAHSKTAPVRLGLLRLADAAPAIVAHELGFFAEEALSVELAVEPSWANVADKLGAGMIEAAVMLPPLAFAVTLGLRGTARRLVVPQSISLCGNTLSLAAGLARTVRDPAAGIPDARGAARRLAAELRWRGAPARLAVVHAFSTHHLLLRKWLLCGGMDPERDVVITTVPPAQTLDALREGRIDGFCAGPPWGEIAARAGVGRTVATSHRIWGNAPEKVLAVAQDWAEANPASLQALLRALLRAAQFCDDAANAAHVARLVGDRLALDHGAVRAMLPGGAATGADENSDTARFFANAATFPWRSHALWFLAEMRGCGYLSAGIDLDAIAARVYRPDLAREAATALGLPVPPTDTKTEGAHDASWSLQASPAPIAMGPDLFCDGTVFYPAALASAEAGRALLS